jgi:hypothetical protein
MIWINKLYKVFLQVLQNASRNVWVYTIRFVALHTMQSPYAFVGLHFHQHMAPSLTVCVIRLTDCWFIDHTVRLFNVVQQTNIFVMGIVRKLICSTDVNMIAANGEVYSMQRFVFNTYYPTHTTNIYIYKTWFFSFYQIVFSKKFEEHVKSFYNLIVWHLQ